MIANDIRIFVKGFNFCGCAKNYFHLKSFFFQARKVLELPKLSTKWSLKGSGPSYKKKIVCRDDQLQNI